MHTIPLQLRFNDIDQMGHVNNAIIMEFFDLGKADYFTQVGVPPQENDFTVMVAHYDVDFHRQILYQDHIAVTSHVSRFGTKSLTLTQQIVNIDSGEAYATCNAVMCGYCRSTKSSAVIPEAIKERIARFDAEN